MNVLKETCREKKINHKYSRRKPSLTTEKMQGESNLTTCNIELVVLLRSKRKEHNFFCFKCPGAHTFGRVQCQFVTNRLYNFSGTNQPDPSLDATYRAFLSQRCPRNGPRASLNDLDPTTPNTFDNHYFTNLEANRGFLQSDQELKSAPSALTSTAPIVDRFASSQDAFFKSFARSMIKMGNIRPLTDPSRGEVRKHCAFVN
jgi:hypothetical protein